MLTAVALLGAVLTGWSLFLDESGGDDLAPEARDRESCPVFVV